MEKIRLFTVRTLTVIAAVCFIFFASFIDSECDVPFYGCIISGLWLLLVTWANFDAIKY